MTSSDSVTDDSSLVASRYVVGIDLGTTNCAMCYVDTEAEPWAVETFPISQWVDFGQREQRESLPSFHYEWTTDEANADYRLPWQGEPSGFCVGVLARDAGSRHPGRRTASAKSWLSHDGVDRTANLLPWHGDPDVSRLSPVEASSRYLAHMRSAWDESHADHPLSEQDVVITLPASFDEVARELTVAAAKRAGLPRVFLIEEPQAAFYAWINRHGQDWQQIVAPGQLILVCDIGGGTTDFTLIRVRAAGGTGGQVQFHRVAVGQHLILGGDNLDLAVAKLAESKISHDDSGSQLTPDQWDRLVQASRLAKEVMLADNRPDTYTISLAAEGSRLIGGAIQVQITADDIDRVLMDGFFPRVDLNARPVSGESGFQEFGLPYAADAAITRHLAEFLSRHRRTGLEENESGAERPDLVLFNGGVMASTAIQQRIVQQVSKWFEADRSVSLESKVDSPKSREPTWRPQQLDSPRLDLAVAQGAAYYAMVRRGQGVRIAANLGRTYYMQVTSDPPSGMCLIPGSAEAGQRFRTDDHPLQLRTGTPVQFPLWVSSTRLADSAGQLLELDRSETSPLPPICTALVHTKGRSHSTVRVVVEAELSEIGTVGLHCVDTESKKRWKLEFDIRSTLETDRQAHTGTGEAAGIVDAETVEQCVDAIESVFGNVDRESALPPSKLVKRMQSITEMNRDNWPPSLLREQWHRLFDTADGRRKSPHHESRWLNLVGFCLRPGYGVAVDDWRVAQTWRAVHGKLAFPAAASRTESMILWRRLAGGLTAGQQQQLAAPLVSAIRGQSRKIEPHEATEMWRLIGALERLDVGLKVDIADSAIAALSKKKNEKLVPALLWSLGRLGSRHPVYGPLNTAVSAEQAASWADELIKLDGQPHIAVHVKAVMLALVQLGRQTGDRFHDLTVAQRDKIASHLESLGAPAHHLQLLTEGGTLHSDEEAAIFGDSLPLGIRLMR